MDLTVARQDLVLEIVHKIIVLHGVVEVGHAPVAMGVLDDTDCFGMIAINIILELSPQNLGLIKPRLRAQVLGPCACGLSRLIDLALPWPVTAPLPLPACPLRDRDLEEYIMR